MALLSRKNSSNKEKNRPLLSLFLVVLEAVLAIVLRLDKRLRQAIYPLVQERMVLCVRTYLPHVLVYATFTENGILLDTKAPYNEKVEEAKEDVTISASMLALVRLFLASDNTMMQKLQFRGKHDDIDLVKSALERLQLQYVANDLLGNFRKLDVQTQHTKATLSQYKQQLNVQQETITELNLALHEAEAALKHQAKRERLFYAGLSFLGIICVLLVIFLVLK